MTILGSETISYANAQHGLIEILDDIITSQSNPTIAIYARRGEIIVRITAKASDVEEAKALISGTEAQIYERLSKFIYGVDDASLAEYLGQELLKSGSTIAFAESVQEV